MATRRKPEDRLITRFWREVHGTLVRDVPMRGASESNGSRRLDAIILLNRPTKELKWQDLKGLQNEEILVIQAKHNRLGMSLMDQSFFSKKLLTEVFRTKGKPKSVTHIALCTQDDTILRPLLEKHGIRVEVRQSE
jgi:hypothetical protein